MIGQWIPTTIQKLNEMPYWLIENSMFLISIYLGHLA